MTFTINRVIVDLKGKAKIYTPIFCDRMINLRGITAVHYDDMDIGCTLIAAIVHKGPTNKLWTLCFKCFQYGKYCDSLWWRIGEVIDSKKLLKSDEFMKNIYMCFYAKDSKWFSQAIVRESQQKMMDKNVTNSETLESVPWVLSKSELCQVKRIIVPSVANSSTW